MGCVMSSSSRRRQAHTSPLSATILAIRKRFSSPRALNARARFLCVHHQPPWFTSIDRFKYAPSSVAFGQVPENRNPVPGRARYPSYHLFPSPRDAFTRSMSAGTSMRGPTRQRTPLPMPARTSPRQRRWSARSCCRGREGDGRHARVVRSQLMGQAGAREERNGEVDDERYRNAQHVKRQLRNHIALQREHDDDGE